MKKKKWNETDNTKKKKKKSVQKVKDNTVFFQWEGKYLHLKWKTATNITVLELGHSFNSSCWGDLHTVLVIL